MGAAGTLVAALVFLALTVLGVVIAMRGRGTMIWLVSVSAFIFGTLAGAMIGILAFDSIIIMAVLAAVCGVLLVVVVRRLTSVGYFIGIGTLSWFLAFIITSEMYVAGEGVSENTLLFIALLIAIVMGTLAACRSKYMATFITAVSGGVITAISSLALIGFYFADARTWIIATIIAVLGICVQIRTYDLKPFKKRK